MQSTLTVINPGQSQRLACNVQRFYYNSHSSKSVHDRLTRKRFAKVRVSRFREKARRNNVLHETSAIKPSALIIQVETAVTRADMVCGKRITV